jgi:hypothetical protein
VNQALVVVIEWLGVPGILPAVAVARRSPAVIFLAPLLGAGMTAVAAELELGIGLSLLTWYVVVAVTVNAAAAAWWLAVGRSRRRPGPPWTWSILTSAVVLGALIASLTGLRTGIIGYDGNAIWLTHALMVSGGHHALLTDLQNPAYSFSNPDYPPLVPAAGALAFALFGHGHLRVAVEVTALLNACALGVVGAGVAAIGSRGRPLSRIAAVAVAASVCVVGFAVTGNYYAFGGYADLLWSAAAVGAVVWGLVLPRSTQALAVAWICAAVASLTKNEGLATALVVLVLISLRYRPPTLSWRRWLPARPENRGRPEAAVWPTVQGWAERAAFVAVPALPGLAWAGLVRLIGLHDAFFGSSSAESSATRAVAAVHGMAANLIVMPVALAVLVAGCCFVRTDREHALLGNPAWLWAACLLSLAIIFTTYVFGSYEIHWWLRTSVARTTIFAQLVLYTDLAIWLIIALGGDASRARSRQRDIPLVPPRTADSDVGARI